MSKLQIALVLALLGCSTAACSEDSTRSTDMDPASSGNNTAGSTGDADDDAGDQGGATNGGGTTGATTAGASNGGTTAGGSTGDAGTKPSTGAGPTLPTATGTCPTFKAGMLSFSAGGVARTAKVWIDEKAAKEKDGPLVFYWHGTGSSPDEAQYGLSAGGIASITALGGIVVGAVATNGGGFPWLSETDSTFKLVDEIVACAEKEIGIDERQIHSVGMSAGGLFTSTLSFARSNLFASVAVYSGGGTGMFAETKNKFPALIFFGGTKDVYPPTGQVLADFAMSTSQYVKVMRDAGHFTIVCDHGGAHSIPTTGIPAVVPFFLAHPYGVTPSPYEASFPATVPSYCKKS